VRSGVTKTDKEFAEVAIQDEGGNPDTATVDEKSRTHAKPKASLQPVPESDLGLDLLDESIWTSIPADQINGKFAQYRRLTTHRLQDLEEQLQLTTAKTKRKVATLKAQFHEHKSKWEAERKLLIEQIDQSLKLQTDAEKEADAAMTQLEEFITEQEKLEQEEEHKRTEALQVTSALTPQDVTPPQGSGIPTPVPGQQQGAVGVTLTPESEQELLRLMQQTDDAKVQEMNARLGTCASAPPAVDMELLSIQRPEPGSKDEISPGGGIKPVSEHDLQTTPTIDLPDKTVEELDGRMSTAEVALSSQPGEETLQSLEPPSVDLLEGYPLIAQKEKTPELGEAIQAEENAMKYQNERESTLGDFEFHRDTFSESSEMTLSKQSTMIMFSAKQRSRLGQSASSNELSKIDGTTEEELRAASAQSRASLRQQFKMKLGEAKQAAEDRRSKSPAILLPTQLTVDDELIIDEDDDEIGDSVNEIGTSPPPGFKTTPRLSAQSFSEIINKEFSGNRRDLSQPIVQKVIMKGISLREHPLLKEYLTVYNGVMGFKDGVGKTFLDKDLMSAHQMMSDLEALSFDSTKKAMPQIVELTQNVAYVLEEVSSLINSVLVFDREPPVSALNMLSREQTQKSLVPNDPAKDVVLSPSTAESTASGQSGQAIHLSEKIDIKELQQQYLQLKEQLEEDRSNYQEQLQRNTVVMKEMQQTINDLQRELVSLDKSPLRTKSAQSTSRAAGVHHKSPSPEASVMFTRLDSERNSKIMKKAVMDDKLDPEKYMEAVSRMDEYVSLPAQRLAHLVKKYIHHTRMKEIEENVKNSGSVDDEVVDVLNKMEDLQNQRAKQWAQKMDQMGLDRLKLANILMETLDTIEQESGIFLIKPMYSYRGREVKPTYAHKLSRPSRVHRSLTPSKDPGSTTMPAPTPSLHYRLVKHEKQYLQPHATMSDMKSPERSQERVNGDVKVTGSGMAFTKSSPKSMWNMQASHSWSLKNDPINSFNTPRILELDVNRMLIGQNNISTKVPYPQTDDRLVNAQQNTLRSYVTVNRPSAPPGGDWVEKRPSSGHSSAGSSGSTRSKKVKVSEIDREIPNKLHSSHPLPPITPNS
ncbi:unnamed protein product, partial [Lymnaea stagnalis]